MFQNFFIFIFSYAFIIFAVLGYGFYVNGLFKKIYYHNNIGYIGLIGILFLVIYSYLSSIFYSHGPYHNLIILLIGFFIFLKKSKIYKYFFKKNFHYLSAIFLISIIGLFIFKTHDDFLYYHFQYSYHLTQNSLLIGLGNFDLGLRTPSSLFYLNSLFYLPVVDYYLFQITPALILIFFNLIILIKIKKDLVKKRYNFLTIYNLLIFIFINIFFYRISEHGTDRSAQILILILFSEILLFINFKNIKKNFISKLFIIVALVISFKAFYVLYMIFFIISIIHYLNLKISFKKIMLKFLSNYYFLSFLLVFFLVIFHNFLISGCLVYPVSLTCFDNSIWAIKTEEVINLNNWYEQWSKAGAGPNYRVDDPVEYIKNFNWVSNWFEKYFFNKVSDFLIGILFLSGFTFYFLKSNKLTIKKNKKIILLICMILILLFEWFYNHPALRYGGYCLIASLLFIFTSILLEKYSIDYSRVSKKITILIIITFTIFIYRNVNRINYEVKNYNYKPFKSFFYKINNNAFKLQNNLEYLINNYEECKNFNNNCKTNQTLKIEVEKKYGKYIFFKL